MDMPLADKVSPPLTTMDECASSAELLLGPLERRAPAPGTVLLATRSSPGLNERFLGCRRAVDTVARAALDSCNRLLGQMHTQLSERFAV